MVLLARGVTFSKFAKHKAESNVEYVTRSLQIIFRKRNLHFVNEKCFRNFIKLLIFSKYFFY